MRLHEIEDSDDELLTIYKNQIAKAVKKYQTHNSAIYRGTSSFNEKNILKIDSLRRSGTSNLNYHNLWLEGDLKWRSYPNRMTSVICSSADYEARGYGNVRIIIPLENVEIGICPGSDFWFSFKKTMNRYHLRSVISFNQIINKILVDNKIIVSGQKITSFNELYEDLEKTQDLNLDRYFKTTIHDSLIEIMDYVYNPDINGFDLTDWNFYDLTDGDNKEIWFQGPYLSVNMEYFIGLCKK